jgi:hypothetical protein
MFSLCLNHIMFTLLTLFVFYSFLFEQLNLIYILFIYGGMGHTDGMINSKMIGEDLCQQTVVQRTQFLEIRNIFNT